MRVHVVGGFLGAGKTTAIRALARHLRESGEKVAVVTNDQGETLVDTSLCANDGLDVKEIPGGCFCCRYPSLEEALLEAEWTGATVALAEAVGSCTDLVATVLSPLVSRRGASFEVAPLSILVDGRRFEELDRGAFSSDVKYLYEKQIEEADVLVLTKTDLAQPDVSSRVQAMRPGAALVRISATTGKGMAEWLAASPQAFAPPLDIDYERYAKAEAELGWANGRVRVQGPRTPQVQTIFERFLGELAALPVTHVKLTAIDAAGDFTGSASLVRQGGHGVIDARTPAATVDQKELVILVNARAALAPTELEKKLRAAMALATDGAPHEWEVFACFSPSAPVPTYRHLIRSTVQGDECCP